jgi:hypothetical protein
MERSTGNNYRTNRRSGNDRRNKRGFSIRSLIFGGRRETIRRQEDRSKIFWADRYGTGLFAAIVVTLFLSVLDALLTLYLINHGAYEVNPIMAYYLNIGPYAFFTVKYTLTCTAVIVLLMFRNVFLRTIRVFTHSLFFFIIGAFAAVVVWQCYLVFYVIS